MTDEEKKELVLLIVQYGNARLDEGYYNNILQKKEAWLTATELFVQIKKLIGVWNEKNN